MKGYSKQMDAGVNRGARAALSSVARYSLLLLMIAGLYCCSEAVAGPDPSLGTEADGEGATAMLDPGIVCRAQLSTEVSIAGEGFSPMPVDIPDDPRAALPDITLVRSLDLDGGAVSDPERVLYSGEPVADPSNAFAEDGTTPLLKWQSQQSMSFVVNPQLTLADGSTGMLAEGIYDVEVSNPNGSSAHSAGTLAVVDRPVLNPVTPGIVCLEQGQRTIELSGTTFLRVDDREAALRIEGVDGELDLELGDCSKIEMGTLDAERCQSATALLAQGQVAAGLPLLTIQNPETAACQSEEQVHLRVVPAPSVTRVVPALACVQQQQRVLVVEGEGFLRIDGAAPTVVVGELTLSGDTLGGCESLPTEGHGVESCTSITLTVEVDALPAGLHSVSVTNPDPAGCQGTAEGAVRIVPEPTIDQVSPALVCLEQADRVVRIDGSDFLIVDGVLPAVQIGEQALDPSNLELDGCEELEVPGMVVQACSEISLTLEQASLEDGLYDITVTNPDPAGCENQAAGSLRVVVEPRVEQVQPVMLCLEQDDRQLNVDGSDFLVVDGEPPAVLLGDTAIDADGVQAEGCETLQVAGLEVERCDALVVTIPGGALQTGAHDVTVTNPDPAGCEDTVEDAFLVIQGPEVTAVVPALVCTDDGSRQLEITGIRFLKIGDDLPAVTLDGTAATVDNIDDCEAMTVEGLTVQQCETLSVTVAQGALSAGRPAVAVTNPDPAGCTATSSEVLTVPPVVNMASVTPGNICVSEGDTQITISGSGFLAVDSSDFTLQIDGSVVVPDDTASCTALTVEGMTVQTCNAIMATVSPSALGVGAVPLAVTNPAPSECADASSDLLRIVQPAEVTGVTPGNVCSDVPTTITITGTDFAPGAIVTIGEVSADEVVFTSSTELQAIFSGGLPAGVQDVTVQNGLGCSDTLVSALVVDPTPIVFFVDPPVIYNDVSIQATIFTTGLAALADTVELVDEQGTATLLDFSSPTRFNRILATIPGDETFAPGDYQVRVTSDVGCVGGLPGAVTITDTLTLGELTIDPAFASPSRPTAVTVTVDTDSGTDEGFESIPRVYLNPADADSDSTATALSAVVMLDENTLTAVVPEGLEAGTYDLIVVNPSGEVGVALAAVTVTVAEPPVILSVLPASLLHNEVDQTVVIYGENFDPDGVELICTGLSSSIVGDNLNVIDSQTVEADFDILDSELEKGDICLVVLTNLDGSSFAYSAISIRNNTENMDAGSLANDMVLARRALSLIAARPTPSSRYLYAIGGDDGVSDEPRQVGTVLSSVESASVDVYGEQGDWALQRNSLPAPRTWAGAALIGRFIYLTGGRDSDAATDAATNTLLRSEVLDPLVGPEILDLDAYLGEDGTGLEGGMWFYRVAATYPTDDPNNPGGESVAGETLTVQLPINPNRIELELTWEPVDGANGYRVYRSPLVDGSVDDLELLTEITCGPTALCDCSAEPEKCRYLDNGLVDTTPDTSPLPPGSLGVWHEVAGSPLNTRREAHATVAAPDLGTPEDDWFLYAFGGRDETGTYLDTYEYAKVTINGDGTQSVSTWTLIDGSGAPSVLTEPRAELGAWALTSEDGVLIGEDEVLIYIGAGREADDSLTRTMDANFMQSGGDLGDLIDSMHTNDFPQPHAGYGSGNANNKLIMFGGQLGLPDAGGMSSPLCVSPPDCLPELQQSWNALGPGNNTQQRIYLGMAQESAFFFLAGGHDGTSALRSTEQTVQ